MCVERRVLALVFLAVSESFAACGRSSIRRNAIHSFFVSVMANDVRIELRG